VPCADPPSHAISSKSMRIYHRYIIYQFVVCFSVAYVVCIVHFDTVKSKMWQLATAA
jgi:hypothetical protein